MRHTARYMWAFMVFLFCAACTMGFAWGAHVSPNRSAIEAFCGIFGMICCLASVILPIIIAAD